LAALQVELASTAGERDTHLAAVRAREEEVMGMQEVIARKEEELTVSVAEGHVKAVAAAQGSQRAQLEEVVKEESAVVAQSIDDQATHMEEIREALLTNEAALRGTEAAHRLTEAQLEEARGELATAHAMTASLLEERGRLQERLQGLEDQLVEKEALLQNPNPNPNPYPNPNGRPSCRSWCTGRRTASPRWPSRWRASRRTVPSLSRSPERRWPRRRTPPTPTSS
jgi:chromosome segregation ATPase